MSDWTSPGNPPIGFAGWSLTDFSGTALEHQRAAAVCCAPPPSFHAVGVTVLGGGTAACAPQLFTYPLTVPAAEEPRHGPTLFGEFGGARFTPIAPRLSDEDVERIARRVVELQRTSKEP